MATPATIVMVCAMAALCMAPRKLQAVILLGAIAYMAAFTVRGAAAPKLARALAATGAGPAARSTSDRFEDAKAAINGISSACARFDEHKAGELAAALDECLYEYMKALSRGGQEAATAYGSYVILRASVMDKVSEAYVVSDLEATAAIDAAAERVASLFAACDAVLAADGKSQPGPPPA